MYVWCLTDTVQLYEDDSASDLSDCHGIIPPLMRSQLLPQCSTLTKYTSVHSFVTHKSSCLTPSLPWQSIVRASRVVYHGLPTHRCLDPHPKGTCACVPLLGHFIFIFHHYLPLYPSEYDLRIMFDHCHFENINSHSQNRSFKKLTNFRRKK